MRLLGPLFRHDLVRAARRQRVALWRTAFGLALLGALFCFYAAWFPEAFNSVGALFTPPTAGGRGLAGLGAVFFAVVFGIQSVAGALLAPQWTLDAVAGERERRTLPFLLVTDLRDREIVLGKLAARLAQVVLFLLTGLPVLSLLQFFGGVDPLLLWSCYGALALTVVSTAALGMACSVTARTPRAAGQTIGRLYARLGFLAAFAPLAWITIMILSTGGSAANVVQGVTWYVRVAGTVAICGAMLFTLQRAVTSIERERTRRTLDDLLVTDLTTDE